jgi:hypothetical protein
VARRTGRRGIGRRLALIAAFAAASAGCAGGNERADLLVTAPRLFDGERMVQDGAVAIRGAEIVTAGRREDVGVDAARTIALPRPCYPARSTCIRTTWATATPVRS